MSFFVESFPSLIYYVGHGVREYPKNSTQFMYHTEAQRLESPTYYYIQLATVYMRSTPKNYVDMPPENWHTCKETVNSVSVLSCIHTLQVATCFTERRNQQAKSQCYCTHNYTNTGRAIPHLSPLSGSNMAIYARDGKWD